MADPNTDLSTQSSVTAEVTQAPRLFEVKSYSEALQIGWVRTLLYAMLLASSLVGMTYRLLHTQRIVGKHPSPMLSANDRSRWLTIRSLIERGGYEIEMYTNDPLQRAQWNTIDKVVHQAEDGRTHEYSSKPPLLATLLSLPTMAIAGVTGWNFQDDLFALVRWTLWFTQILPLFLTLCYFAYFLERMSIGRGTKLFVLASACWGTFITTFAVSLNNHHFAVLSVYWATIGLMEIAASKNRGFGWFLVVGFAAAFAAANELPALSFCCLAVLLAFILDYKLCLMATLPAAAIVAFAAFGTTLVAHHSLRPPYAHRSDGEVILKLPSTIESELIGESLLSQQMRATLNEHAEKIGFELSEYSVLEPGKFPRPRDIEQRWVIRDYFMMPWNNYHWRALALTKPIGEDYWQLRSWDNWYDYPGSYWYDGARRGVDEGEADPWRYAFDCLIGHHGIFSLTPIWILAAVGLVLGLARDRNWQVFSVCVLVLTLVVVGFYLARPQLDRNFGGQTSALRWLFWLSPLWLLAMIPAVEKLLASTFGQWFCGILLLASILSSLTSSFNPWVHPWIYQWLIG